MSTGDERAMEESCRYDGHQWRQIVGGKRCDRCGDQLVEVDRGIFLLDIEHDPAALQALETYAYAVLKSGDRELCDHLIEVIKEVKVRKKA